MSVSFASMDSTHCRREIIGKKIPGSSKEENFNLLCVGNHLPFIYIVFTSVYIAFTFALVIIGNLEVI